MAQRALELPEFRSERMRIEHPVWRLALRERVATLAEIDASWSIDDVLDANELLDMYADAEATMRAPAPSTPPKG